MLKTISDKRDVEMPMLKPGAGLLVGRVGSMSTSQWLDICTAAPGSISHRVTGALMIVIGVSMSTTLAIVWPAIGFAAFLVPLALFVGCGVWQLFGMPKLTEAQVRLLFKRFNRCPSCGYELPHSPPDRAVPEENSVQGAGPEVAIGAIRCPECGGVW